MTKKTKIIEHRVQVDDADKWSPYKHNEYTIFHKLQSAKPTFYGFPVYLYQGYYSNTIQVFCKDKKKITEFNHKEHPQRPHLPYEEFVYCQAVFAYRSQEEADEHSWDKRENIIFALQDGSEIPIFFIPIKEDGEQQLYGWVNNVSLITKAKRVGSPQPVIVDFTRQYNKGSKDYLLVDGYIENSTKDSEDTLIHAKFQYNEQKSNTQA